MKKAWKLSGEVCNGVYFLGCFCHAINLFFNDIFAKCHEKMRDNIFDESVVAENDINPLQGEQDWTIKTINVEEDIIEDNVEPSDAAIEDEAGEDDEDTSQKKKTASIKWARITVGTYTLPQMYFLAMQITKFVRAHSYARQALLKAMQSIDITPRELQLAGLTRWGSIVFCLHLVLYAKDAFPIWLEDRDVKKLFRTNNQRKLMAIIKDAEFFNVAQIVCDALIPLCVLTSILEGDYATISFAWHQLVLYERYLLTTRFAMAFPAAVTFYRSRKLFMYSDVVGLANLLDPRYRGADLTIEQKIEARNLLLKDTSEDCHSEVCMGVKLI
jgi:hypothetical protein